MGASSKVAKVANNELATFQMSVCQCARRPAGPGARPCTSLFRALLVRRVGRPVSQYLFDRDPVEEQAPADTQARQAAGLRLLLQPVSRQTKFGGQSAQAHQRGHDFSPQWAMPLCKVP